MLLAGRPPTVMLKHGESGPVIRLIRYNATIGLPNSRIGERRDEERARLVRNRFPAFPFLGCRNPFADPCLAADSDG